MYSDRKSRVGELSGTHSNAAKDATAKQLTSNRGRVSGDRRSRGQAHDYPIWPQKNKTLREIDFELSDFPRYQIWRICGVVLDRICNIFFTGRVNTAGRCDGLCVLRSSLHFMLDNQGCVGCCMSDLPPPLPPASSQDFILA